jgi:hypothetical protein
MKPAPAPNVPGKTDAERFDNALRTILSVPKEAILKAEQELKQEKAKGRDSKKSA